MNKRYALCVGVNDYPGDHLDLSGCVNDALDWAAVLTGAGYETTVLLDAQATYSNVAPTLARLVGGLGWADRLVFQFSGHGTWVPDRDGDELDGRDEAMCLYDFATGGLLLDDDLAAILGAAAAGTGVLVLSDSCHSGTVARGLLATGMGAVPRFISPADFTDMTFEEARDVEARTDGQPRRLASLISGCSDVEFSYDAWFGDRPNGAFTRAALDTYQPGITLSQWHAAILAAIEHPQTPQLTASTYRKYTRAL